MENKTADKPTEESNWMGPSGERWLANADRFEQMLRPIGHALIDHAALRPGEKVVDIGCGAGEISLELARRVGPTGQVTGLDISPPLVAEANRRAAAIVPKLPVQFELGDAARVSVSTAPVDCLVSRFGVMFFSEPYPAFAHLHTLLRPGGRFVFACWAALKENPWMGEVRNVFSEHFDLPALPPRAPGPFAFQEPDYVRDLLGSAKFNNVEIAPWKGNIPVGGPGNDPKAATDFMMMTVSIAKVVADAPPEVQDLVRQKLCDRLNAWMTPAGVHMPASVWLVSAVA